MISSRDHAFCRALTRARLAIEDKVPTQTVRDLLNVAPPDSNHEAVPSAVQLTRQAAHDVRSSRARAHGRIVAAIAIMAAVVRSEA